jgi:hypothetical protein
LVDFFVLGFFGTVLVLVTAVAVYVVAWARRWLRRPGGRPDPGQEGFGALAG